MKVNGIPEQIIKDPAILTKKCSRQALRPLIGCLFQNLQISNERTLDRDDLPFLLSCHSNDCDSLGVKRMKVTCVSDLHGNLPKLNGGDLLIVAGDLTKRDKVHEYLEFYEWLDETNYRCKVVIAGNHDNELAKSEFQGRNDRFYPSIYLCDSGTEFEGLKIWGSPWTKTFPGMNPHCKAFTVDTDEELAKKWALIPDDVDILVTHSPAYGMRDKIQDYSSGKIECVGSKSLQIELFERLKPKLTVVGHIHEGYGEEAPGGIVEKYVNASHVNEHYKPVNEPIDVEI